MTKQERAGLLAEFRYIKQMEAASRFTSLTICGPLSPMEAASDPEFCRLSAEANELAKLRIKVLSGEA